MANWATAGRTMTRHAARALAASVALAAIGMPAALLASQAPAAAATGKRLTESRVSIAVTSMTPEVAGPGTTITVSGTVTNSSRQPISDLSVQLLASSTQVTSAEMQPGSAAQADLASTEQPAGSWPARSLQPGSTDNWSVRVHAKSIGMTKFGVYPLTAEAQSALGQLAAATTYLPYVPAKKGPYGSSIPARTKISWVLPLIDKPLLGEPWQASCTGAQAEALAQSLGRQGRLGLLVAAGAGSMGAAEAYSAAAGSRGAAQNHAVSSEAPQSLSGYDGVTWAIDPALLANVKALEGCGAAQPRWARAAQSWLTQVRQVTSAEPVFVTPYADPDVAALNNNGKAPDLQTSFSLGQQISQRILHRNLGNAGIAWPADGIAGYSTVEYLAANENVRTLVVSTAALRNSPSTVVRVANGDGTYMKILLANASITNLIATRNRSAGSAFSTAQDFLAQTALAASAQPGSPIIVAPPRRWDPPAGLAADLLTDTASAPWLSPVSLASLAAGPRIPSVKEPHWAKSSPRINRQELGKLTRLDNKKNQLETLAAKPDNNLLLAVATVESSAWQGRSNRIALRMLAYVRRVIGRQEREVQILAEPRVTLGGLKGSVPVSIDNRLGYSVKVKLELRSQSAGVKITPVPGVMTVPAHSALTVKLHVQATQVGSTTITMSLENKNSQPLLPAEVPPSMTIEATQVGVLGVIIFAAALGIFLIAYTARAVHRGRPGGGADQPVDHGLTADQGSDHSAEPAEPDTVMAERTGYGTAGAPGP